MFSTGNGVIDAETNTGSYHLDKVADMEDAHLICYLGEGIKAYVPLDEDYGQERKSVTITVVGPHDAAKLR